MSDPILFGTQRDYAWTAWQTAYGAGDGQGAHEDEFTAWWDVAVAAHWGSLEALMSAAWLAGSQAAAAKAPTFKAWWQSILDTQPVTGKTP